MPIRVDADSRGTRLLTLDLAAAVSGIAGRIADVHRAAGPIMLRTMKRNAPKDTHTLEKSLDYTVNVRKRTLRFGALRGYINPKSRQRASAYLPYVHDGTSRMPGRPFIEDAVKNHSGPGSTLMRGYARAGVGPIDRKVQF